MPVNDGRIAKSYKRNNGIQKKVEEILNKLKKEKELREYEEKLKKTSEEEFLKKTDNIPKNEEIIKEEEECEMDEDNKLISIDDLSDMDEDSDFFALYGSVDEATNSCTYNKNNSMKRQAIFICMTCNQLEKDRLRNEAINSKMSVEESLNYIRDNFKPFAFCFACERRCHIQHETKEMYTKRNINCDCGTERHRKFCQFSPQKFRENNETNVYDKNFLNSFCICNSDGASETLMEEMIQCCLCEDWFHESHLKEPLKLFLDLKEKNEKKKKPDLLNILMNSNECEGLYGSDDTIEESQEMICQLCTEKYDDELSLYFQHFKFLYNSINLKETMDVEWKENHECILQKLHVYQPTIEMKEVKGHAVYIPFVWRKLICQCASCSEKFSKKKLSFFYDFDGDSLFAYEKRNLKEAEKETKTKFEKKFGSIDKNVLPIVVNGVQNFMEKIVLEIKENGAKVITENMIPTIVSNARRSMNLPSSEDDDDDDDE
ncbi:hypothetical protein SNEBB_005116 [Seison nebaliae]|nr:hypothetical protein SNEBB_005116 [Seison nebaliae]